MRLTLSLFTSGVLAVLVLPGSSKAAQRSSQPPVLRVPLGTPTIQEAIDLAPEGSTVLIAPGVYFESISFRGKAITVQSESGAELTTIDGSNDSLPVVRFHGLEGPGSRLIGFTITGGMAGFTGGGGISCVAPPGDGSATPTITDCIIARNNRFEFQTGGLGVAGNPTLERCKILENGGLLFGTDGPISGGGVSGAPIMRHCEVRNNVANFGGGLELADGAVVEDCIIANNHAGPCFTQYGACFGFGGGIRVGGARRGIQITRCLIKNNWVEGVQDYDGSLTAAGGAYACDGDRGATFTNCTIFDNTVGAHADVGGMLGPFEMVNCILWGNGRDDSYAGSRTIRYSDVQNGPSGNGNIDVAPRFADSPAGKLHLRADSPCIDAGDPSTLDPDGTVADMGWVPFLQGNANVRNGSGVNPLCLASTSRPYLGQTWTASVDGASFDRPRVARIFVLDAALAPGVPSPAGELLIDTLNGHLFLFGSATFPAGAAAFSFPLPRNQALLGQRVHAQAWIADASGVHLSNALELFLGNEAR